eukprot:scaffold74968_cov57-Cyclotella_meneghiniana.AAC.5
MDVLEAKLPDGKKLPKWNRRARMGQFLGFSGQHSSTVALEEYDEDGVLIYTPPPLDKVWFSKHERSERRYALDISNGLALLVIRITMKIKMESID